MVFKSLRSMKTPDRKSLGAVDAMGLTGRRGEDPGPNTIILISIARLEYSHDDLQYVLTGINIVPYLLPREISFHQVSHPLGTRTRSLYLIGTQESCNVEINIRTRGRTNIITTGKSGDYLSWASAAIV